MRRMNKKILPMVICCFAISVFMMGCVTESEIQAGSVNRFVEDGVYRNFMKGYSLDWPDRTWRYKNYPEFDLTFEHNDGKAQIFIIGVSGLVRRDYPDGFVDWILNRLQASKINITTHQDVTVDSIESFRIKLDCTFMLLSRDRFGVDRKVIIHTMRQGNKWVAAVFVSPPEDFDLYLPAGETVIASLHMITD